MAESVMIRLEVEHCISMFQSSQHLLRIHVGWWERRANLEQLQHDFFGDGKEDVELDFAIMLDPFSSLFE